MKIVIVGCGRVGAVAADSFDRAGHEVIVLDSSTSAFDRLPSTFGGVAMRGDGTDEDVLRRAGAEGADVFLALTEGDNRNVMAAQLGIEALDARRVIAKINDPLRATAYAELGIATLCRTGLMVDAIDAYIGLPPSGLPGLLQPSGHHDGGDHHATGDPVPAGASVGSAPTGATTGPGASGTGAPGNGPAADGPTRPIATQEV